MEKVISGVYTGLYILFLCSFTVLALLSSREELPAYARDPPWRRPFRRMALWLIGKLESGTVPLEEMVALHERGMALYESCAQELAAFEKRLKGTEMGS